MSKTIEELDFSATVSLNETLSNNVLLDLVPTKHRPRGSSIGSFAISSFGENPLLMYSSHEYVFLKNAAVESRAALPLGIGDIVSIQSCDDIT